MDTAGGIHAEERRDLDRSLAQELIVRVGSAEELGDVGWEMLQFGALRGVSSSMKERRG